MNIKFLLALLSDFLWSYPIGLARRFIQRKTQRNFLANPVISSFRFQTWAIIVFITDVIHRKGCYIISITNFLLCWNPTPLHHSEKCQYPCKRVSSLMFCFVLPFQVQEPLPSWLFNNHLSLSELLHPRIFNLQYPLASSHFSPHLIYWKFLSLVPLFSCNMPALSWSHYYCRHYTLAHLTPISDLSSCKRLCE